MPYSKPKAEEVQRVLEGLSIDEMRQISKRNPFRNERNAKIRELLDRGIKIIIVAEISGFHRCYIRIIKNRGFKVLHSRPKVKIEEVQRVLKGLSEKEVKQLRRDNPFRMERDNKIKELYKRGVRVVVLAEITGLSKTTVLRVVRIAPKYQAKALNAENQE